MHSSGWICCDDSHRAPSLTGFAARSARLLSVVVCCAAAGAGALSIGADDDVAEPRALNPQGPQSEVTDEEIDQWVFQGDEQPPPPLDQLLKLTIDRIHADCTLTEAQRRQLEFAAMGDLKRFHDKILAIRAERDRGPHDRHEATRLSSLADSLHRQYEAGLFVAGSILRKTIPRVLTAEQAARLAAADLERRSFRYRTRVKMAVGALNAKLVLSVEQQQQFIQIILEETQAPRAFGGLDLYVVVYNMSQIPEARLRPLFNDVQWRILQRVRAHGQEWDQHLIQTGYIDTLSASPHPAAGDAAEKR